MEGILTQAEIDLLLREMGQLDGTAIEPDDGYPEDIDEIVPYDLTHPDRVIRGRMPTLEMIHEHFSRLFRQTVTNHMRRPIDVSVRSTELVNFKDFIKTTSHPTALCLFRLSPLRGSGLLVCERPLVFSFVDMMLGGLGVLEPNLPPRDFTNIENRMLLLVINSALEDLQNAWRPVVPLQVIFSRMETHPQFIHNIPASEVVVVTTFDVEVHRAPMTLSICLPYTMLEPIRSKLNAGYQSEHTEVNEALLSRLTNGILQTEVEVKVNLGKAKLSLRKFLTLSVGDHIMLDQDSEKPLDLLVENVPKFQGVQGAYRGNLAMKITDLLYEPRPSHNWMDEFTEDK